MRQRWPEGRTIDEVLGDRRPDGCGDLSELECEGSRLSVFAITGATVEQHERALVHHLTDGMLGVSLVAPEPEPAG